MFHQKPDLAQKRTTTDAPGVRSPVKTCACGSSCRCKNCRCGPHAVFFDTLGNTTRLVIIDALREGPRTVTELVAATGLEQTLVSHGLRKLAMSGFVTHQRFGKHIRYARDAATIDPLMELIERHVQQHCAAYAKPCACGGEEHGSRKTKH